MLQLARFQHELAPDILELQTLLSSDFLS